MKLTELFLKLEPAEFAQIKALLKANIMRDPEASDLFLEKICSNHGLSLWRLGCLTLADALHFYNQGILDIVLSKEGVQAFRKGWIQAAELRDCEVKEGYQEKLQSLLVHPNALHRDRRRRFKLKVLLEMSSDELSSLYKKKELPVADQELISKIPPLAPLIFSRESVSRASSASVNESALQQSLFPSASGVAALKETHYFSEEQLRMLSREAMEILGSHNALKAIRIGQIIEEHRQDILKLAVYPKKLSLLFSPAGITAFVNKSITLEQMTNIHNDDYLKWLLEPHVQVAIQKKIISVDFITKIWFSRCKKDEDAHLVEQILSQTFLDRLTQFNIDFMGLYEANYKSANLTDEYGRSDRVKIKEFLRLWTDRVIIFSLIDVREISNKEKSFFQELLTMNKEKLKELRQGAQALKNEHFSDRSDFLSRGIHTNSEHLSGSNVASSSSFLSPPRSRLPPSVNGLIEDPPEDDLFVLNL